MKKKNVHFFDSQNFVQINKKLVTAASGTTGATLMHALTYQNEHFFFFSSNTAKYFQSGATLRSHSAGQK